MSRLYYSPYRHFRVVIVLHRIRNRMNELFVRIKKVRAKAKAFHYSLKYRKLKSQQASCHNHNIHEDSDHTASFVPQKKAFSLAVSSLRRRGDRSTEAVTCGQTDEAG
jgi:phosphopantetheine adenylyltransferase